MSGPVPVGRDPAMRVAILGNSGGGKSTLARRLAATHDLPRHEIDRLLWREGWEQTPAEAYERAHAALIDDPRWLIDGLGRLESLPARVERATHVILVDLPLWQHFWLAAERQIAWAETPAERRPAGLETRPPTRRLFETIQMVDRDWMPTIRAMVERASARGAEVHRIDDADDLASFGL